MVDAGSLAASVLTTIASETLVVSGRGSRCMTVSYIRKRWGFYIVPSVSDKWQWSVNIMPPNWVHNIHGRVDQVLYICNNQWSLSSWSQVGIYFLPLKTHCRHIRCITLMLTSEFRPCLGVAVEISTLYRHQKVIPIGILKHFFCLQAHAGNEFWTLMPFDCFLHLLDCCIHALVAVHFPPFTLADWE